VKIRGITIGVDRAAFRNRRFFILLLLTVGALIAYVDRVSISAALATEPFKDHFNLSDVDRGWVNSAFFWSYAIMQIPMGWVVDRYGVKWPYAVCFAFWCFASAAIGLMTSLGALIVMRLLIGVAEAVVVPATYRWISNNYPPDESGAPLGLYALGTKFGPALGAPAAASLIVLFDWKAMFLISGVLGLAWLLPWMMFGQDHAGRKDQTPAERTAAKKTEQADVSLWWILSNPFILATLVVYFCYNYFTFFCLTWMPSYLVEQRGLSLEAMGLYTFFSFSGIAIVALAAGWLADEIIRKKGRAILVRKAFILSGFAIASTVVLGARAETVGEALFWNVVSLSGLGLATANNLALCSIMLIPSEIVGRVKGVQNTAVAIAGIVSPLVTGWLLHVTGSYLAPMTLIFAILVLGALTVIVAIRPELAPKILDTERGPIVAIR
jgi:MFS transporter, ACS family, D-galactonate transporter